jgi:hypothetical protein
LNAEYRPPAAKGDVLLALHERPRVIVIVDGYFEVVPSVWHKEILVALAEGVHVFGAASMGALRAAELESFGMIGAGTVYDSFRRGVLEGDDEVALLHLGADQGYRPVSQALVEIRDRLSLLASQGELNCRQRDELISRVKALPFWNRTPDNVIKIACAMDLAPRAVEKVNHAFRSAEPGVKARDTVDVLKYVAEFMLTDPKPFTGAVPVERTVFLEELELEVNSRFLGQPPEPQTRREACDAHSEVLLRLLVRREASRLGITVDEEELAIAIGHQCADASDTGLIEYLVDLHLAEKVGHHLRWDVRSLLVSHAKYHRQVTVA